MTHRPTFILRGTTALALFCSVAVFACSALYSLYFVNNLESWDFNPAPYAGIVIPDTFVYRGEIDEDDPLTSILFSSVKNTIGPSFLWLLAGRSWVAMSAINATLVFFSLIYIGRLARLLRVSLGRTLIIMALIGLMPITLYHSVGGLKEIPTMLFMTAFFYHYIRKEKKMSLIFAILATVFRYQIGFVLAIFWVADRFGRRGLLYIFMSLLAFAALYPLLKLEMFGLEAGAVYREDYGVEGSAGGSVELIRETVPVASMFAVLIRIVQTILEPFANFSKNWGFQEDFGWSILSFAYVTSLLVMLPAWGRFAWRLTLLLRSRWRGIVEVRRLYGLLLIYIFPTAGFSFIHHRYLYTVFALVLIAAQLRPVRIKRVRTSAPRVPPSGSAHEPDLVLLPHR